VPRILNQTSQHFDDLLAQTERHWSDIRAQVDAMERLSKKIIDGRRLRKAIAYGILYYVDKLVDFCSKTSQQILSISNTASLFLDLNNLLIPVDSRVGNPDSEPPETISPVRPSSPVASVTPAQTTTVADSTSHSAVPNVPAAKTSPDAEPTFTLAEIHTCYTNYHKQYWEDHQMKNRDPVVMFMVNRLITGIPLFAAFFINHMKLYKQEQQKLSKQNKEKTAGPEQDPKGPPGKTENTVNTLKEQSTVARKINANATAIAEKDTDVVDDDVRKDTNKAQPSSTDQRGFADYASLKKALDAADVEQRIDSGAITPEKAPSSPTVRTEHNPTTPMPTTSEGETAENSPCRKTEGAGGKRYTNMNGRERKYPMPDSWNNGEGSSHGIQGR
jgi:hypothetical protein